MDEGEKKDRLTAFALVPIIRQQALVFRRLLDPGPVDALRVTQVLVLQNGYRSGVNHLQRAKT